MTKNKYEIHIQIKNTCTDTHKICISPKYYFITKNILE